MWNKRKLFVHNFFPPSLQVFTDLDEIPRKLLQFTSELRRKIIPRYQQGRTNRKLCILQNVKHRLKREISKSVKRKGRNEVSHEPAEPSFELGYRGYSYFLHPRRTTSRDKAFTGRVAAVS